MSSQSTEGPDAKQFWRQGGVLAGVGAAITLGLGAAFMSIGHDQKPRDVPIAAVGPPVVAKGLEAKSKGGLSVQSVPDLAAARQKIDERDVYGAVLAGPNGVRLLLVAPAANNAVANFLRRTLGEATEENVPRIVDAAPLPPEDSGGQSFALILQVLLIGGSIGVVGISKLVPRIEGDPRRGVLPATFLVAYALACGLVLATIAAAFDVGTDATFFGAVLAMSLISLAAAASTAALVALLGPAGSAVTGVLYFIIGAQISGAGTAPEFLPDFWHHLGQALPGGAGTSLLRDVFYFPDASTGGPIAVLAAYAVAGMLGIVVITHVRRWRRARAAPA